MFGQTKIFNADASGGKEGSYYILKLTNEVSYPQSTLNSFKDLVGESEHLYPGIDVWFRNKVMPGIKEGARYAYLLIHEGKPVAEAIVKRGKHTKLCNMRILPAYQNKAIGPILFAHIARLLDKSSERIHFTAPESLVVEREGLFRKLGFINVGKASKFYRRGEDEIVFRAESRHFITRAFRLLVRVEESKSVEQEETSPIVLSVHPKFAHQILTHKKTVELRRRFSKENAGATVFLYATKPKQAIVGEARIASVVEGTPKEIWDVFRNRIGCSKKEYHDYCVGSGRVTAVSLENILPYPDPLPWAVFSTAFAAPIKPPQSYRFLRPFGFANSQHFKELGPAEIMITDGEQLAMFEL